MDFNQLGQGSPFYILRRVKGEKPVLEIGTVKSKTNPMPNYQAHAIPGAFNGMNPLYVTTLTVTVNGNDRSIPDLPINVEIAAKGSETYSGSREAIMQAVDTMVQESKMNLANRPYDEMCIEEGEKIMEGLNHNYAEEKKRAKMIDDLQEQVNNQGAQLQNIGSQLGEVLSFVRKMGGSTTPKPEKS